MRKILLLIALLVVLMVVFPIINMVFKPEVKNLLSARVTDEPGYAGAAAILEAKCLVCHAEGQALPFYANFPMVKGQMEKDITSGIAYINLAEALNPGQGQHVSEPALAMIEYSIVERTMPPLKYMLLHWDGVLTMSEKDTILSWIRTTREAFYKTDGIGPQFAAESVQPLPSKPTKETEKVSLGNKIFHDVRLSHDNTLSCASCHGLDKGGTDQKQFSTGINGQVGDINSPTVFNAGFNFVQFWDGRAANLEQQADGPVNNPIEMGSNWGEVIPKLQKDPEVVAAFSKLYPDGLTSPNVMNAISVFESSLVTVNSRMDKYLMGDNQALTEEEKKGYAVFKEHGCATCHSGKSLGGRSFEKMGLMADYFGDRGDVIKRDYGRFNVTQKESDRFRFKVPTLRNIEETAPYFHDGSQKTLLSAIQSMGKYQSPKPMTEPEAVLIEKFLRTLTGEYEGKPL